MTSRSDIVDFIKRQESSRDLSGFKVQNVDLWPLVRIRIFFALIVAIEKHTNSEVVFSNGMLARISLYVKSLKSWLSILALNPVNTLYAAFFAHRVKFKALDFNRFFDPLMDEEERNGKTGMLLEYQRHTKRQAYYKQSRVFELFNLYPLAHLVKGKRFGTGDEATIKLILNDAKSFFNVDIDINRFLSQTSSDVTRMFVHKEIFKILLKRLKPQKVVLLTYYNPPMMGLILAARQLGIPVSELQHGPQGATHASYSSWTNVPQGGYELLPDEFLCWNQRDADVINAWATSRPDIRHRAVNFGNPWVKYWKGSPEGSGFTSWPEKMILYTTQPVDGVIEPFLADAIRRTRGQYQWWIRLHPRQLGELNNIKQQLQAAGVLDDVNISDATSLPLPEILLHTTLHITRYSGCLLEALEFQVPSIVIDTRGVAVFRDYMDTPLVKADLSNNADNLLSLANEMIR